MLWLGSDNDTSVVDSGKGCKSVFAEQASELSCAAIGGVVLTIREPHPWATDITTEH